MAKRVPRIKPAELVLSAVYSLQQKNGISVPEIIKYVASKNGDSEKKIKPLIQVALNKAKNCGILSEKKGLYWIEGADEGISSDKKYPKPLGFNRPKKSKCLCGTSSKSRTWLEMRKSAKELRRYSTHMWKALKDLGG